MAAERRPHNARQLTELTQDDVQRMAALQRLPIGPGDLAEVTFRLAALTEELEKLTQLDLNQEEPIPLFPIAESLTEG
jgi:Asp-tRNA(Asn)/Glu-tRNA(Gln) amidotransferase C subunit